MRLGSSTTAAATTGPASGPRPASSQPATGQMPLLERAPLAPERRAEDRLVQRQARARLGFSGHAAMSARQARQVNRYPQPVNGSRQFGSVRQSQPTVVLRGKCGLCATSQR